MEHVEAPTRMSDVRRGVRHPNTSRALLLRRERDRNYRTQKRTANLCTVRGCTRPLSGRYRCEVHTQIRRAAGLRNRERRRLLGFCRVSGCPEAAITLIYCPRHLELKRQTDARRREREAAKRGWKYVRVPI